MRVFKAGALFVALSLCLTAHAQTFTAAPTTGPSPLSTTLSWNVPQGTGCVASGAWSGAQAASGTKAVTGLTANTQYVLKCDLPGPPATGDVTLGWDAVTQNTDGSPLTDLLGYQLYYGTISPPTTKLPSIIGPTLLTYTMPNLVPGQYYFALTAINQRNIESDKSVIVNKTIPNTPSVTHWTGTVDVTVLAPLKPKAPVLSVQ